jgi:tetratricopeptide (TPR) repeat protein
MSTFNPSSEMASWCTVMQPSALNQSHAAHAILTRAASLYPTDPTIQFNLACYEAQMGNLDRAETHLKRATEIDAKFRLMALKDPDLEPVWASMSAGRSDLS